MMTRLWRLASLVLTLWLSTSHSTSAQTMPDWMQVSRVSFLGSEEQGAAAEPTTESRSKTMRKKTRRAAHLLATGLTFMATAAITPLAFRAGGELCSREAAVKMGVPFGVVGALLTAAGAWKLSQIDREDQELAEYDVGLLFLNVLVSGTLVATPLVVTQIVNCD